MSGPVSEPMSEPGVPDDVHRAFDAVISTMGSRRSAAFDRLRSMPQLADHRAELDELAGQDEESTGFETSLRDLQRRVYDEMRAAGGQS